MISSTGPSFVVVYRVQSTIYSTCRSGISRIAPQKRMKGERNTLEGGREC